MLLLYLCYLVFSLTLLSSEERKRSESFKEELESMRLDKNKVSLAVRKEALYVFR